MPSYCCVPLCQNREGGHTFPKDHNLAKRWLIAIRRDKWTPTASSVVCHTHFTDNDYRQYRDPGKNYRQIILFHYCLL